LSRSPDAKSTLFLIEDHMGKADATAVSGDYAATEADAKRCIAVGVETQNLSFVGEIDQHGLRAIGSALLFDENRAIYGEGDDAALFFKVASGVVRTCSFLRDGRRQIDAFYNRGNVFGIELGTKYSLSAETVCDATVISYRRRDLRALAANSERFSQQLFSYAMRSLALAQRHAFLLGRSCAIEKLAAFLVDWARYSPGSDVLTLEMPRQDIADYLGLTIETVSRTFAHLEDKALIALPTARRIWLKNLEGLRDLNS
jgi:CRP/FNR family transcriptional regulator, nitrogen fixation regulation protein